MNNFKKLLETIMTEADEPKVSKKVKDYLFGLYSKQKGEGKWKNQDASQAMAMLIKQYQDNPGDFDVQ